VLSSFTRGEGDAHVVLLHGFLGSGRNLATLARDLAAAGYRVLVPDLPGHGASPPLSADPSLRELALGVLDALPADGPVCVVGHSLGGRVGIVLRSVAPQRVRRLIVLDVSPGPLRSHLGPGGVLGPLLAAPDTCAEREEMLRFLRSEGLSEPLAAWLVMNLQRGEDGGHRWRVDRAALRRLHDATRGEDLWELVRGTGRVDLCIRGGSSDFVTAADATRLQALGCVVHTLPGAGHFVHVDAPAALARGLQAALR
jgi:pimeloyl-ACP methyl ester carboxylesterase